MLDNKIYGSFITKVDDKNRLLLNAKLKELAGLDLAVLKEDDFIKLMDLELIDNIAKNKEQKIDETTDYEDRARLTVDLLNFYKSIIKTVTVDKQRRINLGSLVEPGKSYRVVGTRNCLIVEKANIKA